MKRLVFLFVACLLVASIVPVNAQSTPTPQAQHTIKPKFMTVITNGFLYDGPSAHYRQSGTVTTGQRVLIVSIDASGKWYKLASGRWLESNMIKEGGQVSVEIPTSTPTTIAPSLILTPTWRADLSFEEKLYLQMVTGLMEDLNAIIGEIADRVSNSADRPSLLANSTWRGEVIALMKSASSTSDKLSLLDAPPSMKALGREFMLTHLHYVVGLSEIVTYIKDFDRAALSSGLNEWILASSMLLDNLARVEEYVEK